MNSENPTLDILGFEFLEGTPNSTRATLEIDAGNMRFKFCLTSAGARRQREFDLREAELKNGERCRYGRSS